MTGGGRFLTFEGGEGAGKSTQVRRLAARLEASGFPVIVTREPGGTPFAEAIRGLILAAEGSKDAMTQALLFAAARREHVRDLILPALGAGSIVICDRFADSTRAYQGGDLPEAAIEAMIRLATDGLEPDLTFLIDLPVELGLARARRRNAARDPFETATIDFHAAVRRRFLALAGAAPGRFVVIDGRAEEADVAEAIARIALARLGAAGGDPRR